MPKIIHIIIGAIIVTNLAFTGWLWYTVQAVNEAHAVTNQAVAIHDAVLVRFICLTQLPGIIDLTQCPPLTEQP